MVWAFSYVKELPQMAGKGGSAQPECSGRAWAASKIRLTWQLFTSISVTVKEKKEERNKKEKTISLLNHEEIWLESDDLSPKMKMQRINEHLTQEKQTSTSRVVT